MIIVGFIFFFSDNGKKLDSGDNLSGFVVGNNSIYVTDQIPGDSIIVSTVRFQKAGFVVVHEDMSGESGDILGVSILLSAGETRDLPPIMLSRELRDGQTVYAMLHTDDGDGKFNVVADNPVLDAMGGVPVMTIVTVSKDAAEPGIINP